MQEPDVLPDHFEQDILIRFLEFLYHIHQQQLIIKVGERVYFECLRVGEIAPILTQSIQEALPEQVLIEVDPHIISLQGKFLAEQIHQVIQKRDIVVDVGNTHLLRLGEDGDAEVVVPEDVLGDHPYLPCDIPEVFELDVDGSEFEIDQTLVHLEDLILVGAVILLAHQFLLDEEVDEIFYLGLLDDHAEVLNILESFLGLLEVFLGDVL